MSTAEDPNAWMAEQIFQKLSGMGHEIYMYDAQGQRVYDPAKADRMFSDTGKMMVTLGYTKGKPAKPLVTFHTSDSTDPEVLMDVKQTLKQHNLYDHSFDTMPYGKTLEPKMFAHLNKQDVTESAWTGSTRTSRWRTGLTEVVIKHSERLLDDDSARRWCKVRDIFIHAPDGARYRMPIKHILGAKALAQHINQSGQAWDAQGDVIHHMMRVQQQCRKLRNWLQHNDQSLVPALDQMQQKIKVCLKRVSDPNHYAQAVQEATDQVQMWRENAPQMEAPCGEHMQEAWQAVCAEATCSEAHDVEPDHTPSPLMHADTFPEQRELMEWFNQFGTLTELQDADVQNAVDATKSEEPRELLAHLSDEIPGWESKFEQDPKQVLDQITRTLEKIKKVG
jgi:hypothetical protein